MPTRTRSHELETESRRAFGQVLPSAWVIRPQSDDYGVDLEVEIFEDTIATGLTFKVQLKATDGAANRDGSRTVRIRRETFKYWQRLDVSVLIVLYVAQEGTIYARWAHSHNPDPFRRRSPRSQTIGITFERQHILFGTDRSRLHRDVELIRTLRTGGVRLPLPVRVSVSPDSHDQDDVRMRTRVSEAIRIAEGVVFEASPDEDVITLRVTRDHVSASMPTNFASSNLRHPGDDYRGETGPVNLIRDLFLALASLLASRGNAQAGANLMTTFGASARAIFYPTATEQLFDEFVANGCITEALDLIESALESPQTEVRTRGDMLLTELIIGERPTRFQGADLDRILSILSQKAAREAGDGRQHTAGRTKYSIGNILRSSGRLEAALDAYDAAVQLDPGYAHRGYFFRERAGVKFDLERYNDAAIDYTAARTLGGAPEAGYLLSDALLHAGKFYAASEAALEVQANVHEFYRVGGRLHSRMVSIIASELDMEEQDRQRMTDEAFAQVDETQLQRTGVVSLLRTTDALDPRLWFTLARLETTDEMISNKMFVAANLERDDAVLWLMTICASIEASAEEGLLNDMCDTALRFASSGSQLLDILVEMRSALDAAVYDRVVSLVSSRSAMQRIRPPKVVRLIDEEQNYTEIPLR